MYPQDCKYSKEHEWMRREDSVAVVGITFYAQEKLGDVVYVELPAAGQEVQQMKPFGVVESVKAASDLFSPVSGKVVEVNSHLREHPELVNKDPYGQGWMIKIQPSNVQELENLMSAEEYETYTAGLE